MIMTNRPPTQTPRWLRAALRCGAVCLLAGGLIYCTDQSDLTSVDPARVPAVSESTVLDDDASQARQVLGPLIEAIAAEHALPVELTEALGDAAESVIGGRGLSLNGGPRMMADAFVAVTPDDGSGESPRVVALNLAGLRSALSEGPLPPETLNAELARHLRVGQNSHLRFLQGIQLACAADEGASLSASNVLTSGKMTCETTKASSGKLSVTESLIMTDRNGDHDNG